MTPATESAPITMHQAFEAAKVEHSQEQAPPPEASSAVSTDTKPTQDTAAAGASPESATNESPDLISEADWTSLGADPVKQRAELNKRWTQKTQELASLRKTVEAEADLLASLKSDPEGAIRHYAEQLGLTIAPTKQETAATSTAATIADQGMAAVKAALGPDLDFLAEPLSKAIHAVAEQVAKTVASDAVKPVQEQNAALLDKHVQGEIQTVLGSFSTKHPDWKQHEPQMLKIAATLQPSPGMTSLDYMESVYRLATFDHQIEQAGAKAVQRLAKGAEAAEKDSKPVSESQVTTTAPAGATMRDAYQAAKRGERWER